LQPIHSTIIGYFHGRLALKREEVYIVIPVYNHAEYLKDVIHSLRQAGFANIIVVNDGSANDIKPFLRGLPITYLEHRVNLGQGAALQTGFEQAKRSGAEFVVTFDADGQHRAEDIDALLLPLQEGTTDVSLGSRFMGLEPSNLAFSRKLLLMGARIVNFLFTGLLLTDAHNGLRALNRKALEKITITENRMAHASEILFEIRDHGLRYQEVPVKITYTEYSKKRGQGALNSVRIFIDLLLYKLFS
jgi:glycosyltransferase involved in cell wall biosynthesis